MRHLLAALIVGAVTLPSTAQEFAVGDVVVADPWARATTSQMRNGAAFMALSVRGDQPDRLIAITASVSAMAHLHESYVESDIMKMAPVEAIDILPGETANLEPGGLHVMLMGLDGGLAQGSTFPMTLTFERAGTLEIEVTVRGPGAM